MRHQRNMDGLDVSFKALRKQDLDRNRRAINFDTASVLFRPAIALAAVLVCFDWNTAFAQPTVESFEWLDNIVDSSFITPTGVNDDGDLTGVYVRRVLSQNVGTAFAYVDDSFTSLSGGALLTSRANAINNNGKVVGYLDNGNRTVGFTWTGGSINQVDIPNASTGRTELWDVNESGVAAGVYTLVSIEEGQPVSEHHHFTLPGEDLGIFGTEAPNALNDNGVAAGLDGFFPSGEIIDPREVYLYADGVLTTLGQPAVNSGLSVSAINNNNQIAVNWFDDVDFEFRAAVWDSDQGYMNVPTLPTLPYITADGINDAGAVVGNNYSFSDSVAYLSYEGQTYDLADLAADFLDGGELITATDISNGNWIVGYGSYNGTPRAPFRMKVVLDSSTRWIDPAGGLFSDADNWDPTEVPTSDDDILFDLPNTYTVDVTEDTTVNTIVAADGDVTFDFANNSFFANSLEVGGGSAANTMTLTGNPGGVVVSSFDGGPNPPAVTPFNEPPTVQFTDLIAAPLGTTKVIGNGASQFIVTSSRTIVEGTVQVNDHATLQTTNMIVGDNDREGTVQQMSSDSDKPSIIIATNVVLGDDQNFGIVDGGQGSWTIGQNASAVITNLKVGDGGDGDMTIENGGMLGVSGTAILADNLGSTGEIVVSGLGSQARFLDDVFVGASADGTAAGRGTLGVSEDAELTVEGKLTVGGASTVFALGDGVANPNGESSRLLLRDELKIGFAGTAVASNGGSIFPARNEGALITVGDGGKLNIFSTNNTKSLVSAFPDINQISTIDIHIGAETMSGAPDAEVNVGLGGEISADTIFIGDNEGFGDGGILTVDAEGATLGAQVKTQIMRLGIGGRLRVINRATVLIGSPEAIGIALVDETSDFLANRVMLLPGGEFNFNGVIETPRGDQGLAQRNGAFFAQSGGRFEIGQSPGSAELIGDLIMAPGSEWIVEIGGLSAGTEFDQLIVDGNADIEGTIVFRFIDGFAPQAGQTFQFLDFTGTADFGNATFEIENLRSGFEFDVDLSSGGIQFTALTDGQLVPEPGTVALALLGVASLYIAGNRRRPRAK